MLQTYETVRGWLGRLVEFGLLLLALGILLQLLFGPSVILLTGDVVGNLIDLIQALGDRAFVGLIALGIFAWLYVRRTQG
jgi:hypothetical protein